MRTGAAEPTALGAGSVLLSAGPARLLERLERPAPGRWLSRNSVPLPRHHPAWHEVFPGPRRRAQPSARHGRQHTVASLLPPARRAANEVGPDDNERDQV